MIAYRVCLRQLKALGLSDSDYIHMEKKLFKDVTGMYDEMGD